MFGFTCKIGYQSRQEPHLQWTDSELNYSLCLITTILQPRLLPVPPKAWRIREGARSINELDGNNSRVSTLVCHMLDATALSGEATRPLGPS